MSVTICVLLEAVAGQHERLARYEDEVLALLAEHGGRIVSRLTALDGDLAEIQVLQFSSEDALQSFRDDPRRAALAPLREATIAATTIVRVKPSEPDAATVASGTFEVQIAPAEPELGGAVGRFELTKRFAGDLSGTGRGLMLAGGDRGSGAAGYVAIETVQGTLHDREGGFAMQQLGIMDAGSQTLEYHVVPGSGSGALAGLRGTCAITIADDGTHRYELRYTL